MSDCPHVVYRCVGSCWLAFLLLRLFLIGGGDGVQKVVNERDGAVGAWGVLCLAVVGGGAFELVVCCLYQPEYHLAVGDVYGCLAQFLIKRGVVQDVEVLQHQQTCGLEVGIERNEASEVVQGLLVHSLRMLDELL